MNREVSFLYMIVLFAGEPAWFDCWQTSSNESLILILALQERH